MRALVLWSVSLGQYDGLGEFCDLSTASKVFLVFTSRLYKVFSLFAQFSDKPEVFLP